MNTLNTDPGSAIQPNKIKLLRKYLSGKIIGLALFALYCFIMLASGKGSATARKPDIENPKPNYSFKSWFSGDFQDEFESYVKDKPYFGKQLLQVKNQIDYDYLDKFNVDGSVIGKNNTIFLECHINAALGLDYAGDALINERVRKLKVIQDSLKNVGIDVISVFAPGKGSYLIDDIPDSYRSKINPKQKTNFQELLTQFKKNNIRHIDLKTWFERNKPHEKYPIFSPGGMHWTYYAQSLTIDTICKYISRLKHTPVNNISWVDMELSKVPKYGDGDLIQKGNLADEPKSTHTYAYPKVNYDLTKSKPPFKLLRVGDSFYGGDLIMPALGKLFKDGKLWYYGTSVYPDSKTKKTEVWELNVKSAIEENKVLLLLYTEHNFGGFGNHFVDEVYELYTSPETYRKKMAEKKPEFIYIKQIRSNPKKLKELESEAQKRSMNVDSLIYIEAMKLLKQSVK